MQQAEYARVASFLPRDAYPNNSQLNNYMEFEPAMIIDTEEDDASIEEFRALQRQISASYVEKVYKDASDIERKSKLQQRTHEKHKFRVDRSSASSLMSPDKRPKFTLNLDQLDNNHLHRISSRDLITDSNRINLLDMENS